jgi:hypothetical protein
VERRDHVETESGWVEVPCQRAPPGLEGVREASELGDPSTPVLSISAVRGGRSWYGNEERLERSSAPYQRRDTDATERSGIVFLSYLSLVTSLFSNMNVIRGPGFENSVCLKIVFENRRREGAFH